LEDAGQCNIANNLTIEYDVANTTEGVNLNEYADIAKCRLWAYFGGDRQGLSSGNRIFLAGNPDYPNRLFWSASNNPLYFPEDGYNDIGDSSPILALAKVYGSLIVFKENAVYRVSYSYNNDTAYFPVTEISNAYGCDMPNSIQLINNELVYAHTKHGVLLLKSTTSSVQDERIVRKISRNINSKFFEINPTNECASLDIYGYYFLFVGNKAFLWDYNNTPYRYGNTEEEQKRLAWYYWEMPNISKDGNEKLKITNAYITSISLLKQNTAYIVLSDSSTDIERAEIFKPQASDKCLI